MTEDLKLLLKVARERDLTGYELFWLLRYARFWAYQEGEAGCSCEEPCFSRIRVELERSTLIIPLNCNRVEYEKIVLYPKEVKDGA